MRRADYFNEALVTAMLSVEAGSREELPAPPAPPTSPGRPLALAGDSIADAKAPARDEDLTQAPVLRKRLVSLLNQAVRLAIADGLDREYAETADFAVCAFIDEILLSSDWKGREEWMSSPLQLLRHDTATAGEDFYRILDVLLQKAGETLPRDILSPARVGQEEDTPEQTMLNTVLEIFALCLTQGFSGMLFNDTAAIRDKLNAISRFVPEILDGLKAKDDSLFFPAAYPDAPARKPPFGNLRRFDGLDWLLWLTPLFVVGLLYYFYDMRLNALLNALTGGSRMP
jgi:type VI secretion system protein ImpK